MSGHRPDTDELIFTRVFEAQAGFATSLDRFAAYLGQLSDMEGKS